MKKLILFSILLLSLSVKGQITYHNNFNGVYPLSMSTTFYNFDINGDGQNDIKIIYENYGNSSCNNSTGYLVKTRFEGVNNSFGQNKVNGNGFGPIGIDCTNDTLNYLDIWNNESFIYTALNNGANSINSWCSTIGTGTHKQGFRLIMPNPANGALGYKYGYLNYTLSNSGDIIVHDWYYENQFNNPIVANSSLTYPYNSNCVHIDTLIINDTIHTTVYDTVTITQHDTLYTTVTDTLKINATLSLPSPNNQNTITIYPNPAKDFVIIDNGNFALMTNYKIRIKNSLGQQVFNSTINQQQFIINLSSLSGLGLYFVELIDNQGNIVTTRKLLLY